MPPVGLAKISSNEAQIYDQSHIREGMIPLELQLVGKKINKNSFPFYSLKTYNNKRINEYFKDMSA